MRYSERGYVRELIYSLRPTLPLIHDLFIYFIFKFFLTDPRSLIPRSSILDPDFPVNLEVLLIKIILFFFDHWSDQLFQNNQHFQAIEFLDQPVPEKLDVGFLFNGHKVLQVECADSQVQSYPHKHIPDTYVTLGWISTDAFLAPNVNARKF